MRTYDMNPFDPRSIDPDTTDIDDRTARAMLATLSTPGSPAASRFVAVYGAVHALRLALGHTPIRPIDGPEVMSWREWIDKRLTVRAVAGALHAAREPDPRVLVPGDRNWPTDVNVLGDRAPLALWAEGNTNALSAARSNRVAVLGTPAPSEDGLSMTRRLCLDLAGRGIQIVSAGANGIDTEAHRAAYVTEGIPVVVLAGGLDHPYPPSNTQLYRHICDEHGVVLTETPPSLAVSRARSAALMRIIAALSGAVVVVEANQHFMAQQGIHEAVALNRPVGAVPGPPSDRAIAGDGDLMDQAGATQITDTTDVMRLLAQNTPAATPPEPPGPASHRAPRKELRIDPPT